MEWIPVDERLPEEGQDVIVKTEATICNTYFEKGEFDYNRITRGYANNCGVEDASADEVTHWKPESS